MTIADAAPTFAPPVFASARSLWSRVRFGSVCRAWPAWAAVMALAATVRLANLGEPSLTHDEAWRANWSLYGTFSQARRLPPAVYALNHINQRVFGRSEFNLRLPSALAGILAVVVMFELSRRRFDISIALCVAGMAAWHPGLLAQARVMKEFSFEALMSALGLWIGWNAWRNWNPTTFRIFTAFAVLAFAFTYTASLVVGAWAPLLALAAHRQRTCFARRTNPSVSISELLVGVAVVIVAAAFCTWWLSGAADSAACHYHYQQAYRVWPDSYAPAVLAAWAARSLLGALRFTLGMEQLWVPANWVFGTVALLILVAAIPNLRTRTPVYFAYVALLLAGALAAAALKQWPLGPIHCSMFLLPPVTLALGVGLHELLRRLGRTPAAAAVVVVCALYPAARAAKHSLVAVPTAEHLRPVLQYVADHQQPGDATFVYYAADDAFEFYQGRDHRLAGPVLVQPRMDRVHFPDFTRRFDDFIAAHPRVWLVLAHPWGDEHQRYLAHLNSGYSALEAFEVGDASAHLFQRPVNGDDPSAGPSS